MAPVAPGRAVNRSADPFRTLYDANHRRVRRLVARMAGPQEAEDLTQAVFAKAAIALPGFRGDAQASTWLYRIAVNVTSDWLRSRPAHEAQVTVHLPDALRDENNGPVAQLDRPTSPEQELIRKEMRDCIRGVIGQLSEDHRDVLMLAELGGLSGDELAETLGIAAGNAKVRLHRARAALKKALEGRCDFYHDDNNALACEPKPAGPCAATSASGCVGTKSTATAAK
jgi:RNA polymerase sigma-70 factor, ECF subfamily